MGHELKRGTRWETSTAGRDPALALIQGNPYGTATGPGLIVPATPPTVNTYRNRYLFMLAAWQFNAGEISRIVGMRQYVTIGAQVDAGLTNPLLDYQYPLELPITTPMWHFSDANISWHLRRVDPSPNANMSVFNRPNLRFRLTESPALLFEKSPAEVGGYVPPYGGRPPGNVVVTDLGAFQDIRFKWDDDHAWESIDAEIEGPCMVALFASVQQTSPGTRPTLRLPVPFLGGSLPPEEAFLQDFPNAVYYRIAGSLIFEQENLFEEDDEQPWCSPLGGGDSESTRNRRLDT